jgi:hypothetical protein
MHFETVFDAAHTVPPIWLPLFGLLLVGIGAFLVFNPTWVSASQHDRRTRVFGWAVFIIGLLWTLPVTVFLHSEYIGTRRALATGGYDVIEGPVTDFKPMPYSGHASESFTVAGQMFSYSDYISTPCFNNTRSHGGPINDGIYIRATYRANCILRLEIAR